MYRTIIILDRHWQVTVHTPTPIQTPTHTHPHTHTHTKHNKPVDNVQMVKVLECQHNLRGIESRVDLTVEWTAMMIASVTVHICIYDCVHCILKTIQLTYTEELVLQYCPTIHKWPTQIDSVFSLSPHNKAQLMVHLKRPIRLRWENISPPGTNSMTMYRYELSCEWCDVCVCVCVWVGVCVCVWVWSLTVNLYQNTTGLENNLMITFIAKQQKPQN